MAVEDPTAVPTPAAPSPAPASDPKPADPAPLLGGNGAGDDTAGDTTAGDEAAAPPSWRDDWREALSGGDEATLRHMKRFASPENYAKSYRDLQKKMTAGQLVAALPEGATDDEKAAYRKQQGIPDKPEGYAFEFPKEVEATDGDKAALASYREVAHALNLPPSQAKGLFDWWTQQRAAGEQQRYDAARENTIQTLASLRSEYGKDFPSYFGRPDSTGRLQGGLVNEFLSQYGGDTVGDLLKLRLANGQELGSHEGLIRLFANAAVDTAGEDRLVNAEGGSGGPTIDEQIEGMKKLQRTAPKEYWAAPNQEKLNKLYQAREAQGARGKKAA